MSATQHIQALPPHFSLMAKPIGSQCNLRCSYCYYLDKSLLYPSIEGQAPTKLMSDSLLRNYIQQYIEATQSEVINFCWHGGEPLIAGLDFYKRAIKYQNKFARGRKIENTLQTNGLLLNAEWCKFFREHQFLIGISIDGPEDIHDAQRKSVGGGPSFARVMRGIELMRKHSVEFNTLSVVTKLSEKRGKEIYRFLRNIGSHYMQFIPSVDLLSDEPIAELGGRYRQIGPQQVSKARIADWSVSPLGYGKFMCEIYDEWIKRDVGSYFVQLFDATLANHYGAPPAVCYMAQTCGHALVMEQGGDIYSCDHFVYPEYKLGNIKTHKLAEMQSSAQLFDFGTSKARHLSSLCKSCEDYKICRGGCPKYRFVYLQGDSEPIHYLCPSYKYFFKHVRPSMQRMCELLRQGKSPMDIMQLS